MHNKKTTPTLTLLFSIIAIVLLSTIVFSSLKLQIRPPISFSPEAYKLPWYDITDWELKACSRWGGRTQAQQSETFQPPPSYGDMTITLQARKTKARNETLYQITYFLESYTATTSYRITLTNPTTGASKDITAGNLAPNTGATDAWTQYLPDDYTFVTLTYFRGTMTTPIIEVGT